MALSRKLHFQMPAFQLLKGFIKVFKDSGIQTDFYLKPQKLYTVVVQPPASPSYSKPLHNSPQRNLTIFPRFDFLQSIC